jgi:translation initiation factor IF-2
MKKNKTITKSKKQKTVSTLLSDLDRIIKWQKKGIGNINRLKTTANTLKEETKLKSAYDIFCDIEKDEGIIQEMFEWKIKNSDNLNEHDKSIYDIVDAFLSILSEKYKLCEIEKVGTVIQTPIKQSKYYSFQNKYNPKISRCIVLKSGIKMGNKVISPALLEQME